MKNYSHLLALFIFITHGSPVKAESSVFVLKNVKCRSFYAEAYSLIHETDFGTYSISQRIKLFHYSNGKTVSISLNQHRSQNRNLNGQKVIDNEASDWFCLKSATGKHYLWIMFTCANEDSTSCRYNTESSEMYDDTGRALHLDRMTDAQANALYRRLKIPSAPPDGGFITPAHHILF